MVFASVRKWFWYQFVVLQFVPIEARPCIFNKWFIEVEYDNMVKVTLKALIRGGYFGPITWYKDGTKVRTGNVPGGSLEITPLNRRKVDGVGLCVREYWNTLVIRGRLPGSYHYTNLRTVTRISIKDTPSPTDLSLQQIADRKVKITWTAPAQPKRIQYGIYINSNGVIVTQETQYTTGTVPYGSKLTFIIKAKGTGSNEEFYYWSVGLGPKSIVIACDVHNSSIAIIRSDFRNARNGWVTLRATVLGPPGQDYKWLTQQQEVISNNAIFRIGRLEVRNSEKCFGNLHIIDLLIKRNRPGLYQLQVKLDNDRFYHLPINLEGGDPPFNLTLTQLANRRIKATWNASYPFLNYRVFINNERVFGEGITVLEPIFISQSLDLNRLYYFRIRGTTNHYWSEVLGPKGLFILGVTDPSVHVLKVSRKSVLLNIIQYHGGLLPTYYNIKFANITCPEDAVELINDFRFAELSVTKRSTLITNLDQYCSYGLIVVATNVELNSTSRSVYVNISTEARVSSWYHDTTTASGMFVLLVFGAAFQVWIAGAMCTVCAILSCCINTKLRSIDQNSQQKHTQKSPRKNAKSDHKSSNISNSTSILKRGSMFRSGSQHTSRKFKGGSESTERMSGNNNSKSYKDSILPKTDRENFHERNVPLYKSSRHHARSRTSSTFSGSSKSTRRLEDNSESEKRKNSTNSTTDDEDKSHRTDYHRHTDDDSSGRRNYTYERNSSCASSHYSKSTYNRYTYRDSRDANISETGSSRRNNSTNSTTDDEDRSHRNDYHRHTDDSSGRRNYTYERNSSQASSQDSRNTYNRYTRDSRDANISDTESSRSYQRRSSHDSESGHDRDRNDNSLVRGENN